MKTISLTKENVMLGLRFVALPVVLAAPFWLVKYTTAKCFRATVPLTDIAGKQVAGQTTTANVLQITPSPKYFGVLLGIIIVSFLIISFLQVGSKKYRLRYSRAKRQLMVAVASVLAATPIYAYIYHYSQYRFSPNWSCGPGEILHGGLNAQAHFGLGLAPIVASVIIALYLLAPLTTLLLLRPKSRKLWVQ